MRFRGCEKTLVEVLWVLLICFLASCCSGTSKCETCKDLTNRFKEGIEKTANTNFGGGNTHWEEKKLGSFTYSETRLVEILEYSCEDGTKECHHMLEENEELLEKWWFFQYAKGVEEDLYEYLCQKALKVCCPEGTYGPDCVECPTGKERPCSGNGRCEGSGTRDGSGSCSCNAGYEGDICNECSTSKYFEEVKNETHVVCSACHYSCQTSCHGAGSTMCDDCVSGWSFIEGQGCIYCDSACNGCTAAGPENCVECKVKYFHDGSACKACHKSCATNCSDETATSCDECAKGWLRSEEDPECKDVDECADGSDDCSEDTYCQNTEGSFWCPKCDRTCEGCVGPTNKDCDECRSGYSRNEEDECQDVDECHTVDGICSATGERCVNSLGSYKCECQDGFVRRNGKCEVKRKGGGKKKHKTKTPTEKLPKITPDNLQEEVKKMGDPVKGVPIEDGDEMVSMGGNFEMPGTNHERVEAEHKDVETEHEHEDHDDL